MYEPAFLDTARAHSLSSVGAGSDSHPALRKRSKFAFAFRFLWVDSTPRILTHNTAAFCLHIRLVSMTRYRGLNSPQLARTVNRPSNSRARNTGGEIKRRPVIWCMECIFPPSCETKKEAPKAIHPLGNAQHRAERRRRAEGGEGREEARGRAGFLRGRASALRGPALSFYFSSRDGFSRLILALSTRHTKRDQRRERCDFVSVRCSLLCSLRAAFRARVSRTKSGKLCSNLKSGCLFSTCVRNSGSFAV